MTTIKPFLTVANGRKALAFYIAAFGSIEIKKNDLTDQKISAVLQVEGAEFYIADEEPDNSGQPPFRSACRYDMA